MIEEEPSTPREGADPRRRRWLPAATDPAILVPAVGAAVVILLETLAIVRRTGGGFSYTLDDPYIHLRVSELISHGHYGINPGEFAAPSSSIIWPFLLAPFARLGIHQYVPLVINLIATAATAGLIGAALRPLHPGRGARTLLGFVALVLVIMLKLPWLALTGMEHSLHLLVVLTIFYALARLLDATSEPTPALAWILPAAILVCPLLRYEGVVVSVTATAVLWFAGRGHERVRRRSTIALGVAAVVLVAFSLFLRANGVPYFPSSVLVHSETARLADPDGGGSLLRRLVVGSYTKITSGQPVAVVAVLLVVALAWALVQGHGRRAIGLLSGAAVVLVAHVVLIGGVGEPPRYGVYAVSLGALAGITVVVSRLVDTDLASSRRVLFAFAMLAGWAGLFGLQTKVVTATPSESESIFRQQHEMARLVQHYLKAPVAVNDLGWVSYRNPRYVLDLWGLGSEQARIGRTARQPHWMDRVMRGRNVPYALIYQEWFPGQIPAGWSLLGCVQTTPATATFSDIVFIFATDTRSVDAGRRALTAFLASTGPGTHPILCRDPRK